MNGRMDGGMPESDVRCQRSDVRGQRAGDGGQRSEGRGRRAEVRRLRDEETKQEKLFELAYEDFKANLERLRAIVPVSTVCMHGSPLSGINNLDLWKRYDYRELGVIGEPYLDVDFDEVFYLTDTGRRWDGEAVSVRDKVKAQSNHLAQSRRGAKKEKTDVRGRRSDVRGRTTDDAWGRDDLDDLDGWRDVRGRRKKGEVAEVSFDV
jgi:hypothetical protein